MRALEIDATIATLAPGGDGVAIVEIDGERRAVFVPHAAPGDRARLAIDPSRRPARGRVLQLESPGSDRIEPACPWSTRCGGCDWMHLSIAAQERAHVDHLRAALPATWRDVPIASTASLDALAYRTRARIHVQVTPRGRVVVGMHEARTNEPVEVETLRGPRTRTRARSPRARGRSSEARGDAATCRSSLGATRLPVLDVRWDGELASDAFRRLEAGRAGRRDRGSADHRRGGDASCSHRRPHAVDDRRGRETPAPRAGRLRASKRADERRPCAPCRRDRPPAGRGEGGRALRRRREPERPARARSRRARVRRIGP